MQRDEVVDDNTDSRRLLGSETFWATDDDIMTSDHGDAMAFEYGDFDMLFAPVREELPTTLELSSSCNDECSYSADGYCDENSIFGACAHGTDCTDCGEKAGKKLATSLSYSLSYRVALADLPRLLHQTQP
jgi:hypothetical protein